MDRIARIEPFPIHYPDPNDFNTIRRTVLVRVETDHGVVGWGECIAMWPEACKAVALRPRILASSNPVPQHPPNK